MGFQELQAAIRVSKPAPKAKCEICAVSLEKSASISAGTTVLLKKIEKKVCILCAKEVRALIDLRITQAEKGEYTS